jgi:hypothetical protein
LFAGVESCTHPFARRIEAADQLNNRVHVGSKHGIGIFAPHHVRGRPIHTLARHVPIEDVRQFEPFWLRFHQNTRDRTAYRPEAEKRDAQWPAGQRFQHTRVI